MGQLFKLSLKLMWQGMAAIFIVITLLYLILSLFPKIFKGEQ